LSLEDKADTEEGPEDVDMEKGEHAEDGKELHPDQFETAEVCPEDKREAEDLTPLPEGSSRTTGGVLRGRAMGNVLNFPDASDPLGDRPVPAKGTLRLYSDLAHQPSTHQPILTMKTDAKPTLGPILHKLSRSYSPVRSKFFLILFVFF
jgi:hypothetical protein